MNITVNGVNLLCTFISCFVFMMEAAVSMHCTETFVIFEKLIKPPQA